jgi:hypothetical protein
MTDRRRSAAAVGPGVIAAMACIAIFVPYSIVTTAGADVVDELLFDEVAVNPPLTTADFSR